MRTGRKADPIVVLVLPLILLLASAADVAAADVDPVPDPAAAFTLSKARARPGENAVLYLSVEADAPVWSISFALNFDETKVRIIEAGRAESTDGTPVATLPPGDLALTIVNNADTRSGDQTSEGWIHLEVKSTEADATLPASFDGKSPMLAITFLVLPDAKPGFSPVTFETVGPVGDFPSAYLVNRVVLADAKEEVLPATSGDGGIDIIGEIGFFMRGDTSFFDKTRDITDPIMTISWLFLGAAEFPCDDAADANDDGSIDVSDAVYTLHRLFLEPGAGFPSPDRWGLDPTQDTLGCRIYPGH